MVYDKTGHGFFTTGSVAFNRPEWQKERFNTILQYCRNGSPGPVESQEKTEALCLFISSREGEILLVDLAPLIDIGVQVNLRGLDRRMTKVLLYNPEIL